MYLFNLPHFNTAVQFWRDFQKLSFHFNFAITKILPKMHLCATNRKTHGILH